jgi:hypothetical protein
MQGTSFCMPRAENARGKVLGALPRIPARGTPLRPLPAFPLPQLSERSSLSRVRSKNLFKPGKDFLRRAQIARPGRLRAVPKMNS